MSPTRSPRSLFLILVLITLSSMSASLLSAAPISSGPEEGAIVEKATQGWAADRAGIEPGDLLLSWSQENGNNGLIRSFPDLGRLEIEQASFGRVALYGIREGHSREWILPPGRWGLRVRPTLPESLLIPYEKGKSLIATGDLETGAKLWRSAAEVADKERDPLRAAWLQARLAQELARAGQGPQADHALNEAVLRLEKSQPAAAAQLLRGWDWIEDSMLRDGRERAEARLRRASALDPAESLGAAWDLGYLAMIARDRGDYQIAEDLAHTASRIQQRIAPNSLSLLWLIQRDLAIAALRHGDPSGGEKILLETLELLERLAPESLELGVILTDLGEHAYTRGDLLLADRYLRRALELIERLSPNGLERARVLYLLGSVDMLRGDLASAEKRAQRALDLLKPIAPESIKVAFCLIELAYVAEVRGNATAAEDLYRSSLRMQEKLEHRSPYEDVYYLLSQAAVKRFEGKLLRADKILERAQEIQERDKSWPDSYDKGALYFFRAFIAVERGDLALAETLHRRALSILEKQAPGSILVSESLDELGAVAFQRGNLKSARELFRRALSIREKNAPGSSMEGVSLNHIGRLDLREGHRAQAAEHLCRATKVFDQQRKRLGGTPNVRSPFGGTVAEYYQDCVDALIDLGRSEEAFWTVERSRARSFLELLMERDIRPAELPPELADERRRTDAEYDQTQAALTRLSPTRDQAEIDGLVARLRELQTRQEEIAAKVRLVSPKAAALQNPRSLDLPGAQGALDAGTVLLEYVVEPQRTWLFVVQPASSSGPGLSVFQIAISERALRKWVESFRHLLGRPGSDRATLQIHARRLYDLLVRPAEKRVIKAQRALISPDGPLHTLPFAALMRGDRYLAEWKPIHSVLSVAVYAELKQSRPAHNDLRDERPVAFGAPSYPRRTPDVIADPGLREILRRGWALRPLPSTRKEVEAIASLYPQTRLYLGQDATEERAKSLGTDSRLIHFACHGLLDERFPLNSALALTLPEHPAEGQDNGLLQAWEIFESVHLDADLVTLSACDTALGKEIGGEGLVGLTRAFQYAGARTVLASLWGVADYSTARFMERFYRYLHGGKTKDEALRAAQIDQIRQKGGPSHPFYWAAFELNGDWR